MTSAQDFPRFQCGVGLGYARASQRDGVALFIEPVYRIKENLAAGLQFEYAMIGAKHAGEQAASIISFSLNGKYYFSKHRFRPFMGAGAGTYSLSTDILAPGFHSIRSFGWYPRLGFEYGHLSLTMDYHFISDQLPEELTILGIPVGTTTARDANYFGIKLGYLFGRGQAR